MLDKFFLEAKYKNCLKDNEESSFTPPIFYSNDKILEVEKILFFKTPLIFLVIVFSLYDFI